MNLMLFVLLYVLFGLTLGMIVLHRQNYGLLDILFYVAFWPLVLFFWAIYLVSKREAKP